MHHEFFQLNSIGRPRLIANAHKRNVVAIAYIIIWCFTTWKDSQDDTRLPLLFKKRQIYLRDRIHPLRKQLTDLLRICTCIVQTDQCLIICYAKDQRTANAICKSADTLEPTLRLVSFERTLFVILSRLANKCCEVHKITRFHRNAAAVTR